jgi:hypothetical protein
MIVFCEHGNQSLGFKKAGYFFTSRVTVGILMVTGENIFLRVKRLERETQLPLVPRSGICGGLPPAVPA